MDIPYPFGIGTSCFRKDFEISCINNGSAGDVPVLATADNRAVQVLNLSVAPWPEARVLLPVAWQCFSPNGTSTGSFSGEVDFNPRSVYRISDTQNELFVLGCNTFIYNKAGNGEGGRYRYAYYTGCVAYSNDSGDPRDGACAGIGCCHVDIPPGLTDNSMSMRYDNDSWPHVNQEYCPCDYAFIVEKGSYTFRASDLTSMPRDQTMPLVLDWAIRDNGSVPMSCEQAARSPTGGGGYACVSDHSECVNSANGGYVCNCTKGYEGNPYVRGGCTNIDECTRLEEFPCHGVCKDTEGSYQCMCGLGYESDGDPKENSCHPRLSGSAKLLIGVTVGIFSTVVVLLATWLTSKHKELKAKKRELEALERKNGSEELQNVKTLTLFTKEELDKITDDYSSPLGHGGFGKVHKGILPDKTEVAVKASIKVTEYTRDEFVREVGIQSRMMHRNILRLLGCCLRVDVPLLVYEYAAKGSLEDILHGKENQQLEPLTLRSRLDIAIGSGQGLAYMHSYTENGIQHADVKPGNILLDRGLIPKISDFGLSKIFMAGKDYTMNVIGCLPYMDPVYKETGRLTPKSDVYSFGVVLLELISRKPVGYGESSLVKQFKRVYEQDKSGRVLFDKDIATEEDIPILDEIGRLAMECLEEKVEERPAMVSVASALVMLKDSWGKQ